MKAGAISVLVTYSLVELSTQPGPLNKFNTHIFLMTVKNGIEKTEMEIAESISVNN